MRFLVVQHDVLSPAGLVGDRILERGGSLDITMPHRGGPLPDGHADHDGLIVLGGPMAADDDAFPHYARLLPLIRGFGKAGKPVMGICLGAQLVARAHGAAIRRLGFTEFGYTPLTLEPAAAGDPLLGGLEGPLRLMEFHEDTFDLPTGAVPLIAGSRCVSQGFRLGASVYAFQCHLETTEGTARTWARLPDAAAALNREDPIALIERQLGASYRDATSFARTVTDRWIGLVPSRAMAAAQ